MNFRSTRFVFLLVLVILAGAILVTQSGPAVSAPIGNNILAQELEIELGHVERAPYQMPLSSGVVYTLLEASGELAKRANANALQPQALEGAFAPAAANTSVSGNTPASATAGCPNRYVGGGKNGSPNTRVNQDCSLRRQAEEVIAINPTNPNNLIAGQNDSRIGFNHCGYDWSFDGGKTWGDMIPPFWSFVQLDGHTADACSDPTATFDSQGNAYVGGVLFDLASAANAIVVAKSNAGIGGAFYHSPAAGAFQVYGTAPGVVASENDPNFALDKEFIVADAHPGSPKADNVYATYTRFANTGVGVGGNSPIYFSQSTDGGATWSPGIEISGVNAAHCVFFSGSADPDACDQDQGSHPVVGQDGTVYVAFANFNVPGAGMGQVMLVSCPGTVDCSNAASWTDPVKVGDLFDTQPLGPDGATGCPFGRGCLPPNGYRLTVATSISVSVDEADRLYVSWADFRNGGGTCISPAATAMPPCDNDVFYAYSTDGGATWSDAYQLTPAGSAQWQPWSAVTADGTLFVGYYDRSYGNCEFEGCNDITLAKVSGAASAVPRVKYTRLTTASMPNLTMATNPVQAGFLGDYMWVAVNDKGTAHAVWADTRGMNGTVEEDIYFATSK